MGKLAIATVVLVALLAVAQVSGFRTIVTTTIEDEIVQQGQGGSQGRCRQQVQQMYPRLQSCKSYLQQSGSPFVIEMYANQQRQQEQQQLRQCCQPLKKLGQCSCEAVERIVQEQLQQFGQGQGGQEGQWGEGSQESQRGQRQQQVQQILQKARNLPRECNIGRECEIQAPY